MTKRQPSPTTQKIRQYAKVERLVRRLEDARQAELNRSAKWRAREAAMEREIDEARAELEAFDLEAKPMGGTDA